MSAFADWPLRWKVLSLLLLVSALPLCLTALIELRDARALIERGAVTLLDAQARALAAQLDDFQLSLQRSTGRLSRLPDVERFLELPAAEQAARRDELAALFRAYLGADPRLRGALLLDPSGAVVAATEAALLGSRPAAEETLRRAAAGESAFVAEPGEAGLATALTTLSPVRKGGRVIGLAALQAQPEALWQLVRDADGKAGERSAAVLVDPHGARLAQSREPARSFLPASAPEQLVVAHRLQHAPWTVYLLLPAQALSAPVATLIVRNALANGAVVILALLVGMLLARRILGPVEALSAASARLREGDLSVRVPLAGRDELGQLAEGFNAMAASLSAARAQMEDQVAARTEALASANAELAQQNAALAQRTGELTERQARDLAFARTLSYLAGPGNLREVVGAALEEAAQKLGTQVLACYRLDKERLSLISVRGGEAGPLLLSGPVGQALAARAPLVLREVPASAGLRLLGASGAPLAGLVLVPLAIGDRNNGLLAAGFGAGPAEQQLAFLADLALPLALSVARHALHEQTERYALQLAQRNEVLREKSDELAQKQGELTAKNVEVERANHLKSEFLANMSHELRTPLNAVIGFSELMLEEQPKLAAEHVQFVRDILASGRHLLTLINSVLDLAKIEAGRVALDLHPLDPRAQVSSACALVTAVAQRKRISLTQEVGTARSVRADKGKLQQILLNLISNAIKFSPEESRIEVGCADQGDALRFWVRDEGVGISDELRPQLFMPFVQGESPLSKKHEGTGLGLAITRRLVEYQGGEIGVESEPGRGATFWFLLPADERLAGAEPPAALAPPVALPEPRPVRAPPEDRPLVLVVEDDAANSRLLRFHLESAGYAVAEAGREHDALELARRLRPQLVLLDLILPHGDDGLNLLRELKKRPETAGTPVVVVSVVQETSRSRELGAAAHFVKPVEAARLLELVQSLVPSHHPARSRATVLVVDDHDLNRELARTMLERRGCRVLLARDGQEGAEVARRQQPDLVLMDLAMPVKDGLAAARELKADPGTSRIPLIAFTALAMRGDEERARSAGFDGYLSKPIDKGALDAALARFLPAA